jgi:outer membrane protein assembly factor BamB/PKD repeat protein
MIKGEGEMLKRIVSGMMLIMILVSVYPLVLGIQSFTANTSLQGETVQATDVDWWPMFHHDLLHTGYSTSSAPIGNQTLWSSAFFGYSTLSSPAVALGKVYIGIGESVSAFNASTGALLWNYTTGYVSTSSPAVVGGRVYVGSEDNKVYCLDAGTGKLIWSYKTGDAVMSSPAVVGGFVYVGSDDSNVYCLNAATGKLVWNYKTIGDVWSSPAIVDGVVFVGSGYAYYPIFIGDVYALNTTTGAPVWSYTTGGPVYSSPAVVGGFVYVGSDDSNVYCLNAATGKLVWNYTTGNMLDSSPAVVGGLVYVGSSDGKVYCLNATTGTLVWKYKTGSLVLSSPAVADCKVYVGSFDNKIYALDASTGALIWSYTTGAPVWSSPAVADCKVYVGSVDGRVYAFGSALSVSISPSFVAMDIGQSQLLALNATDGTPPYTYQWYLNGRPVTGATSSAWTFTPSLTGTYDVYLQVQDSLNVLGTSNHAKVIVNSLPSVKISPTLQTIDIGQSKTFVSTISGGTAPYAYQWFLNSNPVFVANSSTWTFTPTMNGTYQVYSIITDVDGKNATSNTATLIVNSALSVTITPSSVVMDVGQSEIFASTVSGGTPPFSYQWYANGSAASGAISANWSFTPTSPGIYEIYVNVTDGVNLTAKSFNTTTATVYAIPSVSLSPPSAILDVGESLLFTSSISGGTGPYSYQWYLDGSPVSGATSSTWKYTTNSTGSHTVYVKVTDNTGTHANSNTANVTVNLALSVTLAPSFAVMEPPIAPVFTSTVSGGTAPYTYQWYLNGAPVLGATNVSWLFTPTSAGSYTVYLNVTDSLGVWAKSNVAQVTVIQALTVSITPPSASVTVGHSVPFTSTVSGGLTPDYYQWYLNGAKVPAATNPAWSFTPTSAGTYDVYLNVTDSTGTAVLSNLVLVTVTTPSVGGVSAPITTFSLLIPWLGIVLLLAATVLLKGFIAKKNRHI